MRKIATIEARMSSSRLPGKVMMESAGKPMLGHLITRLKNVDSIDEIVVATTQNKSDDKIVNFAIKEGVNFFRGSESDVLSRVIGAAESQKADLIIQITGDCPIIDPKIIELTIRTFLANNVDYVSNSEVRSYPDGMDNAVFSLDTLRRSSLMTSNKLDREHVTLHIRKNPQLFSKINLLAHPDLHWPSLGLTLDEIDDFYLLNKILEYFKDKNELFSCHDVVSLLKTNREWLKINQNIKRKGDN